MNDAQDAASYAWPDLTPPRCPSRLHGGVLTCNGARGHHDAATRTGHDYTASSHVDRHDDGSVA